MHTYPSCKGSGKTHIWPFKILDWDMVCPSLGLIQWRISHLHKVRDMDNRNKEEKGTKKGKVKEKRAKSHHRANYPLAHCTSLDHLQPPPVLTKSVPNEISVIYTKLHLQFSLLFRYLMELIHLATQVLKLRVILPPF